MRRVVSATLFLLLALLPLYAQRRGGGGVHHGGGPIAFRGGIAAPHRGGGAMVYRGAPVRSYRSGSSYGVARSQVPVRRWGGDHDFDDFHRHHHFGYYGYGYYGSYGYPTYYYPYVYTYPYSYYGYSVYNPGLYYSYTPGYYDQQQQQQTQQLSNQVNNLSVEMQQLRNENDNLRDYIAEHNLARTPPPAPERSIPPSLKQPLQSPEPETPPAVLVYKDGHTIEARNYAIVGPTLWVLSGQHATKVPLADLNLEKTKQENEQRGIEFNAPGLK